MDFQAGVVFLAIAVIQALAVGQAILESLVILVLVVLADGQDIRIYRCKRYIWN